MGRAMVRGRSGIPAAGYVEGAPAGEGMLDLGMIRRAVRDSASWIVESWLPWQGDMETTIRTEREWLCRGIANLKAFRGAQ